MDNSTEKIAYVIMPYGGSDDVTKKYYDRVYSLLIKPAAEHCGFRCYREDRESLGGHIMKNIVEHIAEADIVIADISSANWNVAFELGMRYVAKKSGTILICDDNISLPFDIRSQNILKYPHDWLDVFEDIVSEIEKQIMARCASEGKSDSPFHDVYTALPESIAAMLNNTNDVEQRKIIELNDRLEKVLSENESYRKRIEDAGLDSADSHVKVDYEALFKTAIANSIYNSDIAVNKLRELLAQGDREEFVKFLAKVLKFGYLDEFDCSSIYKLCRRLDIPDVTRVYLEAVIDYYPDNEELRGCLANSYSLDYHNRDKALTMVNEMLGIKRRDNHFELSSKLRTDSMLRSFFDVYIHLNRFRELLEICDILAKTNVQHIELILRNKSIALIKLEQHEEAIKASEELLAIDNTDPQNHYSLCRAMNASSDYCGAYLSLEKCITYGSNDEDYYYFIAGLICDFLVARTSVEPDAKLQLVKPMEKERYSAPFILYAIYMQPNNDNIKRALDFTNRYGFLDLHDSIYKYFTEGAGTASELIDFFENSYDFSFVKYCFTLA